MVADAFLPFDLEYLSSAASVLIVLDETLRFVTLEPTIKQLSSQLLEELIRRGSVPAEFRKYELDKLRQFSKRFWEQHTSDSAENDDYNAGSGSVPLYRHEASDTVGTIGGTTARDEITARTVDEAQGETDQARLPDLLNAAQTPGFGASMDPDLGHEGVLQGEDLSHYFELDQQHMLQVADRLDVSALSQTLDFSEITEDWLWNTM